MKYNVLPMYHPAAALRVPHLWATLIDDWQHRAEKVDSDFQVTSTPSFSRGQNLPKLFAIDTENDKAGQIGSWSIAYRNAEGKLCAEPFMNANPNFNVPDDCMVVAQNWKWDRRVLENNNMPVPNNVVDTMIAAYCLGLGRQDPKDGNKDGGKMVGGLGLKYLARRHLGMQMNNWQEVVDKNLDMVEYNCKDSIATYLLWEKWVDILPKHFWTIDMPLLNVLMKMEDRGVLVDSNFLVKYAESLDERLATLDLKGINPYSPDQVAEYVYGTLGYTPTRFTDTKKPSTDAEALGDMEDPVVKAILEYREVYMEKKKGVSGYAHTDHEGRIHTEFKQTRTATGRLSSANPNLQNVSKGEMRKLFIAKPRHKLVVMDWKKIEYGVLAVVSHDTAMMKAFRADTIYQDTADSLGLDYDGGKVAALLMQYEGSAWKLSLEFGISIDEASRMLYSYYKKYPGIQEYHRQMKEIAHAEKQVTNIFGRVRRLDGMFTEDKKTIRDAEKQAINTPIQGAAGEIVKLAMIALDKHNAPMLLQVHDEIMFEVPEKEAVDYAHWLGEYVPTITEIEGERFYVDVGIGNNWSEAKDKENKIELFARIKKEKK